MVRQTNLRIYYSGYKGRSKLKGLDSSPSFAFCVANGAAKSLTSEEAKYRVIRPLKDKRKGSSTCVPSEDISIEGKSDLSRQLSAISAADVVCLGSGGSGTKEIFRMARGLDKPILPLPFFGEASRNLWLNERKSIMEAFRVDKEKAHRWSSTQLRSIKDKELTAILVKEVVVSLSLAVRKRCLVLMPFDEHFEWVFEQIIKTASNLACIDLVRIDLEHYVGDISEAFLKELHRADFAIAVVTAEKANVLYEVGFAHAVGKQVIFLRQSESPASRHSNTPFYIRNHRIISYPSRYDDLGLKKCLEELCDAFRNLNKASLSSGG